MDRFYDTGQTIFDFGNEFLVECPKCGHCAKVINQSDKQIGFKVSFRCSNCGSNKSYTTFGPGVQTTKDVKRYSPRSVCIGDAYDWYFHYPLWLQIPCSKEILWAYNKDHLDFIQKYLQAGLRERGRRNDQGWHNASLASRLPMWMKIRKHRLQVLKAVAKAYQKLQATNL